MKVLVTGATGFIGKKVVALLKEQGHQVVVLTRNLAKARLVLGSGIDYFFWDGLKAPQQESMKGVEGIINLAGENIGDKRWTEEQKRKIHDSRVLGTRALLSAVDEQNPPQVMVQASAVGIYGSRGDEELDERSRSENDFLAKVCADWEKEAQTKEFLFKRLCTIRIGVVLGAEAGALKKLVPIFKLGAGGPVGSGKQWMSWIHRDDIARLFVEAVTNNKMKGVFNGVAPYPERNKDFSTKLGHALKRPAILPTPGFPLKILLGEMSVIVLEGQKVKPTRANEVGFNYLYPKLEDAFKQIF